MDIIKVTNTSYAKYEEVLLRRDNLRKEAENYHLQYIRVFGDLITRSFEMKVECIRKKKMIAYCQRQVNAGKSIDASKMATFIESEMAQYRKDLEAIVNDVKAAKEGERISRSDVEKIKKIYYRLVKLIHPDMRPDLAEDETIKDLWQRIVVAYTYNRLKDLQELEVMVMARLEKTGAGGGEVKIEDLDRKIADVEAEIKVIINTDPYLYKILLEDETKRLARKQDYEDEIASYEVYSAQLDEVLANFEIERKLS